jgi:uncharacterized protein YbjT (DUF2867 family)
METEHHGEQHMIAVTGAAGNVGRPLVQTLTQAGEKVTALSRRPSDTHRQADLTDPDSLETAFEGADALFLLCLGDNPHAILDVAKARGVGLVVLLSSIGARTRPDAYPQPRAFENAVRQSGLDWTILRPGGFYTNTFGWADTIRAHHTAPAPFGDIRIPALDPADIAAVAATVLREPGHTGRTYELTGPAPISPREQAHTIGDALGTPVRFVEQTRDQARADMLRFMPEPVADATLAVLGDPTADEQRVSPDIEHLLGRPPRTFAQWATQNTATFS